MALVKSASALVPLLQAVVGIASLVPEMRVLRLELDRLRVVGDRLVVLTEPGVQVAPIAQIPGLIGSQLEGLRRHLDRLEVVFDGLVPLLLGGQGVAEVGMRLCRFRTQRKRRRKVTNGVVEVPRDPVGKDRCRDWR